MFHVHVKLRFSKRIFVLIEFKCSFSALTLLVGRQEGHPACNETEWWGAGVVICLEQGADLHMAQLMPLPLTVSCSSKIRIVLPFWYRLTWVVPEKRPLNVCVCVCDRVQVLINDSCVTIASVFNYLCVAVCTAIMLPCLNAILQYSFVCIWNSVKYYFWSTPFGFPYMPFPAFSSLAFSVPSPPRTKTAVGFLATLRTEERIMIA